MIFTRNDNGKYPKVIQGLLSNELYDKIFGMTNVNNGLVNTQWMLMTVLL